MQEVVGVEDGVTIGDMDIFHKHLVLYQRRAGLPKLQVLDLPLSTCPDGVSPERLGATMKSVLKSQS